MYEMEMPQTTYRTVNVCVSLFVINFVQHGSNWNAQDLLQDGDVEEGTWCWCIS